MFSIKDNLEQFNWNVSTEFIPKHVQDYCERKGVWDYDEPHRFTMFVYKGKIKETIDWVLVTDTGGFYKINAKYMLWTSQTSMLAGKPTPIVKCAWSDEQVIIGIEAFIRGEFKEWRDPEYQT